MLAEAELTDIPFNTEKVDPLDAVSSEPEFIATVAGIDENVSNATPDDLVGLFLVLPKFCANRSKSLPITSRNDCRFDILERLSYNNAI